jgi:aerobic C4-dicarboxylate transport protein
VLIANWTRELDRTQLAAALSGRSPFDESTMLDPHDDDSEPADTEPGDSTAATDDGRRTTAPEEAPLLSATR